MGQRNAGDGMPRFIRQGFLFFLQFKVWHVRALPRELRPLALHSRFRAGTTSVARSGGRGAPFRSGGGRGARSRTTGPLAAALPSTERLGGGDPRLLTPDLPIRLAPSRRHANPRPGPCTPPPPPTLSVNHQISRMLSKPSRSDRKAGLPGVCARTRGGKREPQTIAAIGWECTAWAPRPGQRAPPRASPHSGLHSDSTPPSVQLASWFR